MENGTETKSTGIMAEFSKTDGKKKSTGSRHPIKIPRINKPIRISRIIRNIKMKLQKTKDKEKKS